MFAGIFSGVRRTGAPREDTGGVVGARRPSAFLRHSVPSTTEVRNRDQGPSGDDESQRHFAMESADTPPALVNPPPAYSAGPPLSPSSKTVRARTGFLVARFLVATPCAGSEWTDPARGPEPREPEVATPCASPKWPHPAHGARSGHTLRTRARSGHTLRTCRVTGTRRGHTRPKGGVGGSRRACPSLHAWARLASIWKSRPDVRAQPGHAPQLFNSRPRSMPSTMPSLLRSASLKPVVPRVWSRMPRSVPLTWSSPRSWADARCSVGPAESMRGSRSDRALSETAGIQEAAGWLSTTRPIN